jgi:hypothetical protein
MSESKNVAAVQLVSKLLLQRRKLGGDVVDMLVDLSDGVISEDQFNKFLENTTRFSR